MKIMQGDSYPIYMELKQDGTVLTPREVNELEVCVGVDGDVRLRKLLSQEEVQFDEKTKRWYIHPTQQETLDLETGAYQVSVRIRYRSKNPEQVIGITVGILQVVDGVSEAVI